MQDQPAEKPLSGQELVIVAIILAILSAILVPQYSRATEPKAGRLPRALGEFRSSLSRYCRNHAGGLPPIFYSGATLIDGDAVWSEINGGRALINPLNGCSSIRLIDRTAVQPAVNAMDTTDNRPPTSGNAAPPAAGWIVNISTGRAWATAADAERVFDEASER